ncbi:actinorhodin transporter [Streptomyces sp. CB03234]|uniref:MFS transporter n=1 Tax=Streptomyces sp. (strain CB03234) TaxID=1703937 RepID=UPI000938DEEF|nr:MFS transporter [Streptomyces sp. CB03234]OKJ99621.1 actinorhodin transporter [Streptomyces sp. CB03234]
MLASLLGGMFLGNVDIAVVNVAIPSIRDHLHASGAELELIVSGYTLAYAMLLITSARLGEIRGRRWAYLWGLAVFTLSSLVCGLAPDSATLVGARVVQGIGAALMVSQVLTSIQVHFDGAARRRALGAYTGVLGVSSVIGQALGGVLVQADILGTGWRPIFLINVPIGIVLLITSFVFLPGDEAEPDKKLDMRGVGLLSLSLFLLVTPLVLGRDAGWPLWTWLCLVGSVPAFVLFVRAEQGIARRGGSPLMNVALLARRHVVLALLSQAATRAGYFALLFVLALYLQQGLGRSAAYSGVIPIAWVATFALVGPVLGRLPGRVRRLAAPAGGLLMAVAFAGVAAGAQSTAWLTVLLGIGGIGYGAAFSGTLTHLTESVEARFAPDVSGLFNTTLQVGGTLGVAVFGTVYLDLAERGGVPEDAFTTTNAVLAALSIAASALIALASKAGTGRAAATR